MILLMPRPRLAGGPRARQVPRARALAIDILEQVRPYPSRLSSDSPRRHLGQAITVTQFFAEKE